MAVAANVGPFRCGGAGLGMFLASRFRRIFRRAFDSMILANLDHDSYAKGFGQAIHRIPIVWLREYTPSAPFPLAVSLRRANEKKTIINWSAHAH